MANKCLDIDCPNCESALQIRFKKAPTKQEPGTASSICRFCKEQYRFSLIVKPESRDDEITLIVLSGKIKPQVPSNHYDRMG